MRRMLLLVAMCAIFFCASPAMASLPHYNSDIGYTIWLPKDWTVASSSELELAEGACKPLPMQGMTPNWEAGYVNPESDREYRLLVEVKSGRKMRHADISNFNNFLVRSLRRSPLEADDSGCLTLKNATYFPDKKVLRLETETGHGEHAVLGLTYVVYTRKGMLTFVAHLDPADEQTQQILDKAVLSLYLDDAIRY
ncbi:hypothetical protein [uncultured Pseudodesulfovibrio sp.]|uniref:hypothetical protein n=1 Tax=uncultured Pseudodesulfovibrio sp. TaxID=2035858 RepID=UPI0029C9A0FA|nr:hypothetical protein [uncultured Pseudodesulfovibrio sp.]